MAVRGSVGAGDVLVKGAVNLALRISSVIRADVSLTVCGVRNAAPSSLISQQGCADKRTRTRLSGVGQLSSGPPIMAQTRAAGRLWLSVAESSFRRRLRKTVEFESKAKALHLSCMMIAGSHRLLGAMEPVCFFQFELSWVHGPSVHAGGPVQ